MVGSKNRVTKILIYPTDNSIERKKPSSATAIFNGPLNVEFPDSPARMSKCSKMSSPVSPNSFKVRTKEENIIF